MYDMCVYILYMWISPYSTRQVKYLKKTGYKKAGPQKGQSLFTDKEYSRVCECWRSEQKRPGTQGDDKLVTGWGQVFRGEVPSSLLLDKL